MLLAVDDTESERLRLEVIETLPVVVSQPVAAELAVGVLDCTAEALFALLNDTDALTVGVNIDDRLAD